MAICLDVETQPKKRTKIGGSRASLFVYAMAALENMAFLSNGASIITYFFGFMNFSLTKSATTHTNFMGTAFLLSLFGGFISDTCLSRFKTCILFGCIEAVGFALLTVQAQFPQLRPIPCKDAILKTSQCQAASSSQEAFLLASLYLVALGSSGVKAALPSLGADQFDERNPKEAPKRASFFNWFLFSITIGGMLGVTFLVWISANQGWDWSFGVCTIAVSMGLVFLSIGRSSYRNNAPKGSPFVRIAQVFVAAIRNRNLPIPKLAEGLRQIGDKETGKGNEIEILERTDQFKFLDRAAIVGTTKDSTTSNAPGAWRICTVTQVEETKILIRMLPIILSTIFMNTCLAQLLTLSIQQGTTMDRSIRGFKVPAASIPFISLFFLFILVPVYERIFVPIARKLTGIPTVIRQLQRVGVGLVLSAVSMAIAGVVETRRKSVAIKHNMVDSLAPLPISVFWLGIQYAILGMADLFTLVGLLDFFYAESSSGMKSLGTAISWCSRAFGYYMSTVVVSAVNKVSDGWLASNNLNRDKLNYFYYLLALLSVVNFGVYLMCASWYKYKKAEMKQVDTDSKVDQEGKV